MTSGIELRPLLQAQWEQAKQLMGRAFSDYEYAHTLYGNSVLDRLAGVSAEYGARPWRPQATAIGAWAGSVLVGAALAYPPGLCPACGPGSIGPEPDPNDPAAVAGATFDAIARAEHDKLPEHGYVGPVGVEPIAHGQGVGAAVMAAALDGIRERRRGLMLLECLASRERFYGRLGFTTVAHFDDPYASDMLVMTAEL